MRISYWSSDVCSSDLQEAAAGGAGGAVRQQRRIGVAEMQQAGGAGREAGDGVAGRGHAGMVTGWGAAATVRGRKTEVAMIELDGPRLDPADGGAAKALVVMLHGVGADVNDLIGIAPLWAQGSAEPTAEL